VHKLKTDERIGQILKRKIVFNSPNTIFTKKKKKIKEVILKNFKFGKN